MEKDEQPPSLPQYGAPKPVQGIPHAGKSQGPMMKMISRMLKPKTPMRKMAARAPKHRKHQVKFY